MQLLKFATTIMILSAFPAFALEDCNKFSSNSELSRRLECLQGNNKSLSDTVAALSAELDRALREKEPVIVQNGD
jgi:cytochrome c-type biogenesis protein CcmH/NrfF